MTWSAAEKFCLFKGGHLASVTSPSQAQKLEDFVAGNGHLGQVWLGGTDEAKEGVWTWSDGSKWSEEHWGPNKPESGFHSNLSNCLIIWSQSN